MVWPWEAIKSRRAGGVRNLLQADRAASAKTRPRKKLSWLISAAGTAPPSAIWRILERTGLGSGREAWSRSLALRRGGAPEIWARAASMPSAEVPDMRPRTSKEFLGMERF